MSNRGLNRLVRQMRVLIEVRQEEATDAQLIDRFVNQRDQTAFATLVYRHGPMVQAVCRRELYDVHDADDAFQATFLVLVRKASLLKKRERVASWLHGVAYRIARKARMLAARRRAMPLDFRELPAPERMEDLAWRELQLVLDEELQRLPAKYREPIILCYLEGLTYADSAQCLRVPAGTVSGRLDRARELLRAGLMRRGFTLSAGLLGTLLGQNATAAGLSHSLLQSTVAAATAFTGQAAGPISGKALLLAQLTLRSLFYAQCKAIACIVLVSLALLGGSFWLQRFLASQSTSPVLAAAKDGPKEPVPGNQPPWQQRTDAQRVVDRAILALGGSEKAASLRCASWTMVWNPGENTERKHRITARGHDQFRMEMEYLKAGKMETSLYILNKDVGWRRDQGASVAEFPAAMLTVNKGQLYALRLGDLLTSLEEEKVALKMTGEATMDQRAVIGLQVEHGSYPVVQLYFDKASGLLYRTETLLPPRLDGAQSKVVYTFEDYRDCEGLLHFTRVTTKQDDQPESVAHIRDFQVRDQLDDHVFDKP